MTKIRTLVLLQFLNQIILFGYSQEKIDSINKISYKELDLNSPTKNEVARTLYNKGYEYFHQRLYNHAILCYSEAIKLDSNFTDAYDNLALSYRQKNNLDSAEFYYLKSLSILNTNCIARMNLGLVYSLKNKINEAKIQYLNIIKLEPDNPEGYYGLANMYFKEENYSNAINQSKIAYRLWRNINIDYSSDALRLIGDAFLYEDNIDSATIYYKQVVNNGNKISDEFLTLCNIIDYSKNINSEFKNSIRIKTNPSIDNPPKFRGLVDNVFYIWLKVQLKSKGLITKLCITNEPINISFNISSKGKILDILIENPVISKDCKIAINKLILKSEKHWTGGTNNGKPVKVNYVIPINILN